MKKITLVLMVLWSISLYGQINPGNEDVSPVEIGDRYREIIVPDSNDIKVKLSDYCGKGYILLEFGVTWCRPCERDIPILKAIYDKYHPYGLTIISVFLDEKRDLWKKYIAKNAIKWIHLSDLTGWKNSKAAEIYGVKSVPFYIIINPQGTIVYKRIGGLYAGNTLESKLQELYGF